MSRRTWVLAAPAVMAASFGLASPAWAQASPDVRSRLERLDAQLAAQAAQLAEQTRQIAAQQALLDAQKAELTRLGVVTDSVLATSRGAGAAPSAASPGGDVTLVQAAPLSGRPVGEAPAESERVEVASLPEGMGVLTPRGGWVIEPTIDFTHGSTNRLVFRGVEIVTGIQIGQIEASDADRNAVSGAIAVRRGLLDRLEVEARVPYLYRTDRVTTLVQNASTATQTFKLEGQELGDVELAARYQLNRGLAGDPIFVASARVKSDTGKGPFEVDRDAAGIATELATGSGFWGVEAGLNFLYPTDPAVIFGGVTYLAHLSRDIDKMIGGVQVGRVDPGDSISFNAGFGFALNPRFSFSLGYQHSYIFPTETELGGTKQRSDSLQVGAFSLGWSFRLTDGLTVSNSYEIGTTSDSPDMRVVFRLPYRF